MVTNTLFVSGPPSTVIAEQRLRGRIIPTSSPMADKTHVCEQSVTALVAYVRARAIVAAPVPFENRVVGEAIEALFAFELFGPVVQTLMSIKDPEVLVFNVFTASLTFKHWWLVLLHHSNETRERAADVAERTFNI